MLEFLIRALMQALCPLQVIAICLLSRQLLLLLLLLLIGHKAHHQVSRRLLGDVGDGGPLRYKKRLVWLGKKLPDIILLGGQQRRIQRQHEDEEEEERRKRGAGGGVTAEAAAVVASAVVSCLRTSLTKLCASKRPQ